MITDEDRMALYVERTRVTLDAVAEGYVELAALVEGRRGTDVGGTSHVEARTPVDLHVLDLRAEVETFVADMSPLVRGALRMGLRWRGRDVPGALAWLRDALGHVAAEDPDLARDLGSQAWTLRGRVERACGRTPQPYRLAEPCPTCERLALFLDPVRGVVRCTHIECSVSWPVEYPLLAWSTASGVAPQEAYMAELARIRA